jgi:hypothetical protein
MQKHLGDGSPVATKMPRRLAFAHSITMTGLSDLQI